MKCNEFEFELKEEVIKLVVNQVNENSVGIYNFTTSIDGMLWSIQNTR